MSSKPIIAMNADFRPAKKDSIPFSWINTGYYDCVAAAGGVPVIVPPLAEEADLRAILSRVDGIVLTGCKLDLDPTRLGLEPHPSTRIMPSRREDFDRRLAELAYEMKIPTLAIGIGMQLLNTICGGTLFQHVPENILKALHHRDPVEACLRHVIEIVPGTKVDQIYGPGEIRVNSDHHMAVDHLAPCFRVSATALDGVVEAYESAEDDWWCLGVQFHPENQSASALDMQVFDSFMEGCREQTRQQSEPMIYSMSDRRAA